MTRLFVAAILSVALPLAAGEPLSIEDRNFMPESGWNRRGSAVQVNSFYLGGEGAHEVAGEWSSRSFRHQFSYTLPLYTDRAHGFGDASLNYRFQLVGGDSGVGIAPRISILLPTRSDLYGGRTSGVQVSVPVSADLSERVSIHTAVGATWFRDGSREWTAVQRLEVRATERLTAALDASFKACDGGSEIIVWRPGVQYSFDGPGGSVIAPGIAVPLAEHGAGVMLYVALEHAFGR